ncbi:MAG TPA: adenylyltransferase/cytidyltransferase family protein [Chitinophagales bacterium]|nr:adenylyltransferase/cytidyltransferase family protein [Chitinophagales bacterium]
MNNNLSSKIIIDLDAFLQQHERKKQTIVFTNGCFDLLHEGHLYLLKAAKKLGDILIVAVNDDASVKRLKGITRPIESIELRMQKLANLEIVDYVIPFEEDTPLLLIEKIKPNVLVKGGDYKKEEIVGNKIALQTVIIPLLEGFSTTKIIEQNNP